MGQRSHGDSFSYCWCTDVPLDALEKEWAANQADFIVKTWDREYSKSNISNRIRLYWGVPIPYRSPYTYDIFRKKKSERSETSVLLLIWKRRDGTQIVSERQREMATVGQVGAITVSGIIEDRIIAATIITVCTTIVVITTTIVARCTTIVA